MAFCSKCGAKIINEGDPFCSNCGAKLVGQEVSHIPLSKTEGKANCPNCNTKVHPRAQSCWHCGHKLQGTGERKSEKVVLILAVGVGLFGCLGIGHMYLGRLTKGFVLLFAGLIIDTASSLFLIGYFLSKEEQQGPSFIKTYSYDNNYLVGGGLVGLVYLVLWIWQIVDAKRVYRKINKSYIEEEAS